MTEHLHPHSVADLELAPLLIAVERNLAQLREAGDIEYSLVLELNDDASYYRTLPERGARVLRYATRLVPLHGWTVSPSADGYGLEVSRGDFTVTVAFGRDVTAYVTTGRVAGRAA